MRELVIFELMSLIEGGHEIYGSKIEPIKDRNDLDSMSNRDLLDLLMNEIEFQG
jgi:hypothetical protein